MTKLLVLFALLATLAATLLAPAAQGLTENITVTRPALHVGSRGIRVKNLQWLLRGNAPSRYTSIHTYHGPIDGRFGRNTGAAVYSMKYRLGFPKAYLNRVAGDKLVRILLGKERRPITWIATAVRRQAGIARQRAKLTSCQTRMVRIAQSQVGVHEIPWHSNRGPRISYSVHGVPSFQSSTGAYGAAWCASFAQWVLKRAGAGTIAGRSAAVFGIRTWAANRHALRSTPFRGDLVLFLNSSGHMGIVVGVSRYGFTSVEGNYSDSVAQVYHSFSKYAIVFVRLSNCPNTIPGPRPTGDKIAGFAWWQIVGSVLFALLSAAAGHWHWKRRVARKLAAVEAEIEERL